MSSFLFLRIDSEQDLLSQEFSWLLINNTGKIEQWSEKADNISHVLKYIDVNTQLVLIIPDKWVSFYTAEIPIKDSKKQLQAVPYVLEDKIISDVGNMHFSVGSAISNNVYIVAAIAKDKILNLLDLFTNSFSLQPQVILTDAMCLYNNEENNSNNGESVKIYLNGINNQVLILNKKIIVSDLDNLSLIIQQLGQNIQADIFKLQIEDINPYFKDSLTKLTINSEQNIDKWLPLLATSWFHNKRKAKFNLANSLIKQNYFNFRFHDLWRYTAAIMLCSIALFYGYKFLDNYIYNSRQQEMDMIINAELLGAGIENNNLNLAEKQIDKLIQDYEQEIVAEAKKDKFYTLLARFSESFTPDIKVKKILFKDNGLELTISQNPLLTDIKNKLNSQSIMVQENLKTNTEEVIWLLSMDEKLSLNI